MSSFRSFIWDPTLLISQMFAVQTSFYTVECVCMLAYSTITSYDPSVSHIFSLQPSRIMALIQLIGSVSCAFALSIIVQRAKQCLDFTCTLHFFHLVFCIIFNGSIPTFIFWWLLQIGSAVICTVLGEYLCMVSESKEIKLGGGPSRYDV
ncbi:unnamed protein product [Auanema sp. JU1783]|nr:unnamed protein product [Auanema sp. JU1783]